MAGRLSRVRRPAFVVALAVSALLYAYSLAGIVSAGDDLPPGSIAKTPVRSAPAAYDDCPASRDRAVRL